MKNNLETNILLVGMMGVGKTTIGLQLARVLNKQFFDTDHELENRCGVSVSLIFELEGEASFRKRESKMLENVLQHQNMVLATGGGIILSEQNRHLLKQGGWIVYLSAIPEIIVERTLKSKTRPLLQTEDRLERITEIMQQRVKLYEQSADYTIDVNNLTRDEVVHKIGREFKTQFSKSDHNE